MQCETASSEVFESEGFTIKLPDGWDSAAQEMEGTVLFLSLPELGPQSSLFISVQKSPKLELHDSLRDTKATIKGEFPEANFLLEREVKQDGARWGELVYTYSDMEFLQLLAFRNGYSYTFTATTLEELFRERLPEFRQIFGTFRFR